jgi:putative addiction module component (TIGR02574 family)
MFMEQNISEILKTVLKLPAEQRAFLAGSLLESLEETLDSETEAAWEVEVLRRVEELDTGAVAPVPWAEARRRLYGK